MNPIHTWVILSNSSKSSNWTKKTLHFEKKLDYVQEHDPTTSVFINIIVLNVIFRFSFLHNRFVTCGLKIKVYLIVFFKSMMFERDPGPLTEKDSTCVLQVN